MIIEILDEAEADLVEGFHYYERQESGLGWYFLDSPFSDIDSLLLYAGTHNVVYGYHRCLAMRFPFAVFTIQSRMKSFGYMQFWIAVAIRRGHESA